MSKYLTALQCASKKSCFPSPKYLRTDTFSVMCSKMAAQPSENCRGVRLAPLSNLARILQKTRIFSP